MDPRKVLEAIVYVLRTGCQWKALPRSEFGSASSVHKYFLEWKKKGVFGKLWREGLAEYDEMEGIAWSWQSIDGAMMKAPMALEAVGPNPTDRGKNGTKRSVLVDGRGIPLSLVVSGAQKHDVKLLEPTLDHIAVKRPQGKRSLKHHLCADKGYTGEPAWLAMEDQHYIPHVHQRGKEVQAKKRNSRYRARRWVVERTLSWLNRNRKLLLRFEKKASSHEALLKLACALIVFRKVIFICG